MKLVLAVIRPSDVEAVTKALREAGIASFTLCRARSPAHGNTGQWGRTASAPSPNAAVTGNPQYAVPLEEVFRLEAAVKDSVAAKAANAVLSAMKKYKQDGERGGAGGAVGMPQILVLDLKDVVRVRTEERGDEAL